MYRSLLVLLALLVLPLARPAAAAPALQVPSNYTSSGIYPGEITTINAPVAAGVTGFMLYGYHVGVSSDQAYFFNSIATYSGPVPSQPPGQPWAKLPVYQGSQGNGLYISTAGQSSRDLQFTTYASPYAAVLICDMTGATPQPTSTPQPATPTPTKTPTPQSATPTKTATPQPATPTSGSASTPTNSPPTPTNNAPTPTPGFPSNAGLQIIYVEPQLDAGGATDEYVLIRNFDTVSYNLNGWTLEDVIGHQFTFSFPNYTIPPGGHVRVWTGSGTATTRDLYWGRGSAIWNNPGDSALLYDTTGALRSRYDYTDNACDGFDVAKTPGSTTLSFSGYVRVKALVGDLSIGGYLYRSWWPAERFNPGSYSASADNDAWGTISYGIVKVCPDSAPTATVPPSASATATGVPPSAVPPSAVPTSSMPTAGVIITATPNSVGLYVLPNTPAPFNPGPVPTFGAVLPSLQPLPPHVPVAAAITTAALVQAVQHTVATAVAPVEQFTSWSDSLGLQGWDAGVTAAAPTVAHAEQTIGMLAIIGQLLPILPVLLLPLFVIIIRAVLSLVKYVKQIIPFQ